MTISWMPVERCPQCGYVLDYFETFSSVGAQCGSCGWKKENDDSPLLTKGTKETNNTTEKDDKIDQLLIGID